jgi:drug/metabolite transporter (DMT)-like permease
MRAHTRGHLAAILTIFIWGVTFISIKVLLNDFSPIEAMFYRQAVALAALLIIRPPAWLREVRDFAHASPAGRRATLQRELLFMAAGLTGVTLYFIFQNTALDYTLASNVGVLISVAPLFTALVSALFLRSEKLGLGFFIGFGIAILGIVLISYNGSTALRLNPLGDLLSLLAAGVWAFYSVSVRKLSEAGEPALRITQKAFFYGLLFLLPLLPLFDFHLGLERLADLSNLLHTLFLGLGASALCFVTWNYAVSVLGPVRTSVYIYMTPVITVVASALLLGERITPVAVTGVALILAGLVVSERQRSQVAKEETSPT